MTDEATKALLAEIRDLMREHTAKTDTYMQRAFSRQNGTIVLGAVAVVALVIAAGFYVSWRDQKQNEINDLAAQELKQRIEINKRYLEETKQQQQQQRDIPAL